MADGVLFEQETLRGVVRDLQQRADAGVALTPPTPPDAGRTTDETSAAVELLGAANAALAGELDAIASAISGAVDDLLAADQAVASGFSGTMPQ